MRKSKKEAEIPSDAFETVEIPQKDFVQIKFSKKLLWIPFILLFAAALFYAKGANDKKIEDKFKKKIIPEAIAKIVRNPSMKINIDKFKEANGVYEFELKLGEEPKVQQYTSYITKDGKIVFTSGIKLAEFEKTAAGQTNTQTQPKDIPKKDTPEVDLFVMSYCPFGLQIEKGILPVLETLKDKIKFNLKFVSYAMHGEKEIDENLKQYCIAKEEPSKLHEYLKCFVKNGNTEECTGTAGINMNSVNSCVTKADSEFKVKEKFNDKDNWGGQFPPFDVHKAENTKYAVSGSPTLVINGTQVNASRDPAGLLSVICSGASKKFSECDAKLSTTAPNAGFDVAAQEDSGSNATCN